MFSLKFCKTRGFVPNTLFLKGLEGLGMYICTCFFAPSLLPWYCFSFYIVSLFQTSKTLDTTYNPHNISSSTWRIHHGFKKKAVKTSFSEQHKSNHRSHAEKSIKYNKLMNPQKNPYHSIIPQHSSTDPHNSGGQLSGFTLLVTPFIWC